MAGLRERKKQQTHEALSRAAVALFLERGFDEVSVADIAAAAEVSKPTLFKYFPTKPDLVLHRIADHEREAARVVLEFSPGSPIEALHRHFVAGLEQRDPVTGLNDDPEVLAYHRLVFTTPALVARLYQLMVEDEQALAEALGNDLAAAVSAAQLVSVQRVLARRNWQALVDGARADDLYPVARVEADEAFVRLALG
jgi:AcrR family transcriptional regulator